MDQQWLDLPARGNLLCRALVVALRVVAKAVRVDQQYAWTTTPANMIDLLTGDPTELDHVRALHLADRHVERGEPPDHAAGQIDRDRRALCPAVVFADHQQWQAPQGSHVEGLVDDPLAQGAVADEHHAYRVAAGQLVGKGNPRGRRHDAALNAVRLEARRTDVLAAAHTAADTGLLAHDFGQQTQRVARLREVVAVASVVAENVIAVGEVFHHRHRVGLLPDAGVGGSVECALLEQLEQSLLKPPDESHTPVAPVVDGLAEAPREPLVCSRCDARVRFGRHRREVDVSPRRYRRHHVPSFLPVLPIDPTIPMAPTSG